jgi:AbrB family looped-hinge helix DNA binding protein
MHSWTIIHTGVGTQEVSMKAVVAERGQVTIPKRLRERLGIRPGTVLEFREEADRLVAEKAETADALDRWYGSLGQKRRTDDVIRSLRGEP